MSPFLYPETIMDNEQVLVLRVPKVLLQLLEQDADMIGVPVWAVVNFAIRRWVANRHYPLVEDCDCKLPGEECPVCEKLRVADEAEGLVPFEGM